MKKISVIALVMALLMCLCSFAGCAKDNDTEVPKGMKLASGEKVDYCMFVPEAWRVDKSDLYTSAYFSSGDATSISATAYGIGGDKKTVDDWWKGFEEEMKGVYTDVSKAKATDAKIDGIKGKEYVFSAKLAENEYKFIVTAVIKDYYVYYITYTSTSDYYEDHIEEYEQVIGEFKFKD